MRHLEYDTARRSAALPLTGPSIRAEIRRDEQRWDAEHTSA
jgi:hypothetical protein